MVASLLSLFIALSLPTDCNVGVKERGLESIATFIASCPSRFRKAIMLLRDADGKVMMRKRTEECELRYRSRCGTKSFASWLGDAKGFEECDAWWLSGKVVNVSIAVVIRYLMLVSIWIKCALHARWYLLHVQSPHRTPILQHSQALNSGKDIRPDTTLGETITS